MYSKLNSLINGNTLGLLKIKNNTNTQIEPE